uniref:RNase H type-1 domain-containing protein n=1 Tax=Arundo donax TaxID=35708 RepID=A0A0A8XNQ5_ARUDO
MEKHFLGFEVKNIPRAENNETDVLAKPAAQGAPATPEVLHETLTSPATLKGPRWVHVVSTSEDWRVPLRAFIEGNYKPEDKIEEQRLRHHARGYVILNDVLYKKGVCEPYLRCLSKKGQDLLKEIHKGLCASHLAPRSLMSKAFR